MRRSGRPSTGRWRSPGGRVQPCAGCTSCQGKSAWRRLPSPANSRIGCGRPGGPPRRSLQDNGAAAEFFQRQGEPAAAILDQAAEAAADMILMGSYGHGPLVETFLGSTVDDVLRGARVPVLLCTYP